jgi:hypothetical protein
VLSVSSCKLASFTKVEINKKVQFVELEFSTLENLLVKAKLKTKEDSQTSLYHKVPSQQSSRDFFLLFSLKPLIH